VGGGSSHMAVVNVGVVDVVVDVAVDDMAGGHLPRRRGRLTQCPPHGRCWGRRDSHHPAPSSSSSRAHHHCGGLAVGHGRGAVNLDVLGSVCHGRCGRA